MAPPFRPLTLQKSTAYLGSSPYLHLQMRRSDWAGVNWIWWATVWRRWRGRRRRDISAPTGMEMMSLPLGPWLVSVERMSHFQCVSSELALCHMGCRGHRRLDGNINQYAWPYVTTPGVLLGHWLWRNLQMSEERGVQCHHMHYILKGQTTQIGEKSTLLTTVCQGC